MATSVYPTDAEGNPIDTPDWRNAEDISKEASAVDSPLIVAVRKHEKDPSLLETALAAPDVDVNAVDKYGMTALHLALKSKQTKAAIAILETGKCDINLQSRRGFTPLMVAAWKGDADVAQLLLDKYEAKKYVTDSGGRNAWGIAHDWHREEILEIFKRYDFHFHNVAIDKAVYDKKKSTTTAYPPAPKWRPNEKW